MLLEYLRPFLYAHFTRVFQFIARASNDMWDTSLRWGFGPRVEFADEEAATGSGEATPLLGEHRQAEGTSHQYGLANNIDIDPSSPTLPSSTIASPSLPALIPDPRPSPALVLHPSYKPSVLQSFMRSKLYRQYQDLPEYPNYLQPSLPPTRFCEAMDTLFAPIHQDLLKLKNTTPESLPPYNARMRSKGYPEVLQQKLLPIGRFIVKKVAEMPEEERPKLELQLCRYVADKYWPLPAEEFTHLKVHEIYRNIMFRDAQRSLQPPESACKTSVLATGEKGNKKAQ